MPSQRRPAANPFHYPLIAAAAAFVITACAYCVMMVHSLRPETAVDSSVAELAWLAALDRHGPKLMSVELALLALATVGTIACDARRSRRAVPTNDSASDQEKVS